jgi:hypothetical protein
LTPRTPLATNARFIETAAGVHSYSQLWSRHHRQLERKGTN